jgi:hypothetical protein
MKGKIFTTDEVDRMLPLVSRIADDIVASYGEVNEALHAYQAEEALAQADATRDPILEERNRAVERSLDRFQRLIEEIEALGGTLRDYERGSVDFYGEVDGAIVYLCWQRGEAHIAHWHKLEEGFSRRRPLTVHAAA